MKIEISVACSSRRAIAVIGAARDENKIGYKVLSNIVSGGFRGQIYPVNPQGGEMLGLKTYRNIEEVNGSRRCGQYRDSGQVCLRGGKELRPQKESNT